MSPTKLSPAAVTVALATIAPSAGHAQQAATFPDADRAIVTIDGLAGIVHQRSKVGDDDTQTITVVGTPATTSATHGLLMPGVPLVTRPGFHYLVSDYLSLGSALYYSDSDNFGSVILLAPRVGFLVPVGDTSAFWLRAGLTFQRWKINLFGENTVTTELPGVEALFVLSPVEHFAFTIGGMAEISVHGKARTNLSFAGISATGEEDVSASQFGLTFGTLVSF